MAQQIGTSVKVLNDGRQFYTTHNGFKYFVTDKKGKNDQEVKQGYYQKLLRLFRKENSKKAKRNA